MAGLETPILVCVRDRVTHLRLLVEWLERAGHERIVLVDNASTYEPLLQYLADSPHGVVRISYNAGARALWDVDMLRFLFVDDGEPFVWTDPDVVPTGQCPMHLVAHLGECLERFPQYDKAGVGLLLGDVPHSMQSLAHERRMYGDRLRWHTQTLVEHAVYDSHVDTTFALYRPGRPFTLRGCRTGYPFLARHMPWYMDELDEEHAYYLEHAERGPTGTTWQAPAV